jgi:transposase
MKLPNQWYWVLATLDGRYGLDRLVAYLLSLTQDPRDGAGYVFCNHAGNRLRILMVDATGIWLCHRRLHKGAFVRPKAGDRLMNLSLEQMRWLCLGVDWQRLSADRVPQLL